MVMVMEMAMNETHTKEIGNYSDESPTTSASSGGTADSFSAPPKRLRKASTDATSITADDDTDCKTLSTRPSISEEFNGSYLLQPSDPLQQTALGEEIGKRRCTTIEDYCSNKFSWEERKEFLRSLRPKPESRPQSEIWRVDPGLLASYARQALKYFQAKTGEHYLYSGPRSMCLCSSKDSEYKMTHLNFFARPCGKTSESLMFAALEHGPVRRVVECCTVPLFKSGDVDVPCIKHPANVDCLECLKFGDSALCYEAEEEPCCIDYYSWSSVV